MTHKKKILLSWAIVVLVIAAGAGYQRYYHQKFPDRIKAQEAYYTGTEAPDSGKTHIPSMAWDEKAFLFLNQLGKNRNWDYLFAWATFLGDGFFVLPVALFLMLIWDKPRKAVRHFILTGFVLLATGYNVNLLKIFFDRERPHWFFYEAIHKDQIVINTVFGMPETHSFPSGHSAAAFALVTFLNLMYGKKLSFLYILAAWVGFTRIYVGAHFPSDVFAGAAAGMLSAWILYLIFRRVKLLT